MPLARSASETGAALMNWGRAPTTVKTFISAGSVRARTTHAMTLGGVALTRRRRFSEVQTNVGLQAEHDETSDLVAVRLQGDCDLPGVDSRQHSESRAAFRRLWK